MKIGDKVKIVKGNPFGKVGKIILEGPPISEPANMSKDQRAVDKAPIPRHFTIKDVNLSEFPATEDQLELVEEEIQLELDE